MMDKYSLRVRTMQRLGNVLENEGDYRAAQTALDRALANARTDTHRASILNDMGWVMMQRSQPVEAQKLIEQALLICETKLAHDAAHQAMRAQILDHLGKIYEYRGELQAALEIHQRSLQIKTELDDTFGMAESENNVGTTRRALGHLAEASRSFEHSLKLLQQVEYPLGIAVGMMNIGTVLDDLGKLPEAIEQYQLAQQTCERIGYRQGSALSLDNLATCYDKLGEYARALTYLDNALAIYTELGDLEGEAHARIGRSQTLLALNQREDALIEARAALKLAELTRSAEQIADARATLARALRANGDKQGATEQFQEAISLYKTIGNLTEVNTLQAELDLE